MIRFPYALQLLFLQYQAVAVIGFLFGKGIDEELKKLYKCNASVILAGLFPIVIAERSVTQCTGLVQIEGVQEALAMIYSVLRINRADNILPGVTVGVDIKNTCGSVEHATQNVLSFDVVQNRYWDLMKDTGINTDHRKSHGAHNQKTYTAAIVGVRKSSVANSISTLTNIFDIPFVSYGSTSPVLSNKDRFHSFARTVPNDRLLSRAIIKALSHFHSNYVIVFYTNTEYGKAAAEVFEDEVKTASRGAGSVCIAASSQLSGIISEQMGHDIKTNPRASTVIVFAQSDHTPEILETALRLGYTNHTWIFSGKIEMTTELCKMYQDSISPNVFTLSPTTKKVGAYEFFLEGIYTSKEIFAIIPEVKEYIKMVQPNELSTSPWIPYVIDAVTAVAMALHSRFRCNDTACMDVNLVNKSSLMPELLKTQFRSSLGYNFRFDEKGDMYGPYELEILQLLQESCRSVQIGFCRDAPDGTFTINLNARTIVRAEPVCMRSCPPGKGIVVSDKSLRKCCWVCRECTGNEYSSAQMTTCETCNAYSLPDDNHTSCIPMSTKNLSYEDPIAIAIMVVTVSGEICLLAIAVVVLMYRNTHVIRASNKELLLLKLIGALLAYASPQVIINLKHTAQCRWFLYLSAFSFSLMMGSLFTRNNRIYRILHKSNMRKGLPRFLSNGWQLFLVASFVAAEMVLLSIAGFFGGVPISHKLEKSTSADQVESICHFSESLMAIYWVSHGTIVLMCTYQAMLTRNIPDDYNEARNIYVNMMAISIQLAFLLPTFYYTTGINRIFLLSFFELLSATAVIVCIFLPKIYIVIFNPKKNIVPQPFGLLGTFVGDSMIKRKSKNRNSSLTQSTMFTSMSSNVDGMEMSSKLRSRTVISEPEISVVQRISSLDNLRRVTFVDTHSVASRLSDITETAHL